MNKIDKKELGSEKLLQEIRQILTEARSQVVRTVNTVMLFSYWNIGKAIVEMQGGANHAKYGDNLLEEISKSMVQEFGKGFTSRNLRRMRVFYLAFPIWTTLLSELTWSHYLEILKLGSKKEQDWYLIESKKSNWSVRQLQRAISTRTYSRVLAHNQVDSFGAELLSLDDERPENNIKNPYIFEFLGLSKDINCSERNLEESLLNHLSDFLLELGKGFSLYSRQFRIIDNSRTYHCDLVFFNTTLKCFVAIDLKVGELKHGDIGQIDMYRRYIDENLKQFEYNPTIGLLLVTDTNETIVKYSILNDYQNLFVSKYLTVLPTETELKQIIQEEKALLQISKRKRK